MLTPEEMLRIVQSQLALDLNCTVEELRGEQGPIIFTEAKQIAGCRPFPRNERYFEIVSMGSSIVVSATPERLAIAKEQMQGKSRDEIFSLSFIRGLYLHFLPNIPHLQHLTAPASFTFELLQGEEVLQNLKNSSFPEAIIYDKELAWQTDLAVIARQDKVIVGVAGASQTCARLWQIGIQVSPEHRQLGVASYLVNRLTWEVLAHGGIPSYDVIASHIASQKVANRAGYFPAWVSDWRCNFVGLE